MALPLTGGGCYPNHNANTPVFNDLCSDWKVEKVEAVRQGDDVLVKVAGAYKEFSGSYDLKINAGGELSVTYSFDALEEVNPRQWGLVLKLLFLMIRPSGAGMACGAFIRPTISAVR